MVALVTDRERVLYQSAFGVADVATGRPLAPDALFRIASMTKAGHLGGVDATRRAGPHRSRRSGRKISAGACRPEGASNRSMRRPATISCARRRRPPTVRHFLTHTSGLAYPFTSAIWRDFKPRAGETYPFGGPLLFDPGERWHYSTSTDVVGRLVEVVSGQKLEDYFRQHIFAPLKMDDTSYNVPEAKGPRLVAQQQRAGEQHGRRRSNCRSRSPGSPSRRRSAAAASPRPPSDYGRFVRMLLNGGALDGARVLKAETVALMGQNHIGAVSVPALKSALPRSADFTFIADGRDKWGLGFLITDRSGAGQALARQPELGRHQQHVLLDRSGARHRRRDHDAVSAVRRRQGAGGLRRVRARRLSRKNACKTLRVRLAAVGAMRHDRPE